VSFLSFANPENGDPNTGMPVLLSCFHSGFRPTLGSRDGLRRLPHAIVRSEMVA